MLVFEFDFFEQDGLLLENNDEFELLKVVKKKGEICFFMFIKIMNLIIKKINLLFSVILILVILMDNLIFRLKVMNVGYLFIIKQLYEFIVLRK